MPTIPSTMTLPPNRHHDAYPQADKAARNGARSNAIGLAIPVPSTSAQAPQPNIRKSFSGPAAAPIMVCLSHTPSQTRPGPRPGCAASRLFWMGVCWSPELPAFSVSLSSTNLRLLLFGRACWRASISSKTSGLSWVSEKVHPFTAPGLPFKCSWILPALPLKCNVVICHCAFAS